MICSDLKASWSPWLLLFISLQFIGCASAPKIRGDSAANSDPVFQRVLDNTEARVVASGSGNFSFRSPKRNVSAAGILVVSWPGSYRLELQDPLGGMVGLLVVHAGQYWAYVDSRGRPLRGAVGDVGARKAFLLPVLPDDLARLLLAKPNFAQAEFSYTGARPGGVLRYAEFPGRSDRIFWDSASEQLSEWHLDLRQGARVEAKYSNYRARSGINFPHRVELHWFRGQENLLTLVWTWSDLETYIPQSSNLFQIPPAWAETLEKTAE